MRTKQMIIALAISFLIFPSEQAIGQQGQEGVNPYSLTEKVLVGNSLVSFFEKCNCLKLIINKQIRYVGIAVIRLDENLESFDAVLIISSKKRKKDQTNIVNQSHYDISGKLRIRKEGVFFDKIDAFGLDGAKIDIPIIY